MAVVYSDELKMWVATGDDKRESEDTWFDKQIADFEVRRALKQQLDLEAFYLAAAKRELEQQLDEAVEAGILEEGAVVGIDGDGLMVRASLTAKEAIGTLVIQGTLVVGPGENWGHLPQDSEEVQNETDFPNDFNGLKSQNGDFGAVLVDTECSGESNECNCPIDVLVNLGCKCGGK
jgi:hypothetical protein